MSQPPKTPAAPSLSNRQPTSHERTSGRPWDASYHDGPAPWDIGGPQSAVVRVVCEGGFAGAVLDAGCGTGENALHIASLGLPVLGVDVAETALAMARRKARDRGIAVDFVSADAFRLDLLHRTFDTVLDCGLFHTFNPDERRRYVASLASVTRHGGTLYVLCFSDAGPDTGPHPVGREALKAAFDRGGWNVVAIAPDRIQTRYHSNGAPAWFATIKRTLARATLPTRRLRDGVRHAPAENREGNMAKKRSGSSGSSRRSTDAPWDRANPKKKTAKKAAKKSKRLSGPQKAEAKARARKAGRPYPNLVDNMAVTKKSKASTRGKPAKTAKNRRSAKKTGR